MRLTPPKSNARFGDVEIRGVQQVLELEAQDPNQRLDGANKKVNNCYDHDQTPNGTQAVYPADLQAIQARTAIVVPCKNESIDRMRGVWAAIPASSLIIVISGSTAEAYAEERDAFRTFCVVTGRSGICVHQGDPQLAAALRYVGVDALLGDDGLVYKGKGEGMVIATMLAATARGPTCQNGSVASEAPDRQRGSRCVEDDITMGNASTKKAQCDEGCLCADTRDSKHLACSNIETTSLSCCTRSVAAQPSRQSSKLPGYYCYIGFIDADNYVPGSVHEYCRAFSAGLVLANADDAMVRINWAAKPKVKDGRLEFKASGRSSQILNLWLNRLLREISARIKGDVVVGDDDEEDDTDEGENYQESDHICTGNAGEHAMSMSLALKLRLANGYAIEPFHFLDILGRLAGKMSLSATHGLGRERLTRAHSGYVGSSTPSSISPISSPLLSSLIRPANCVSSDHRMTPQSGPAYLPDREFSSNAEDCSPLPSPISLQSVDGAATPPTSAAIPRSETAPAKVQILQIRTLNPHFHDNKGEAHVVRMWQQGLSAIYHSPLTATLTKYRNSLRTAIFSADSVGKIATDLPTPPATNCASVADTPPDVSAEKEDRGINGAAVEAAASWQPEKCRVYPAPGSVDLVAFRDKLESGNGSFWRSGGY